MDHFSLTGFSASNMLSCVADGEDIYQVDYMGNRRLIGKTLSTYQELEGTTKQYYDKLVELGVITPQKTPEEMMADMQNVMKGMLQTISDLQNEVKEMQKDGREKGTCRAGEDVPEREPRRGRAKGGSGDQRDGE
ncbi:MAG: hypothetical protein HDT14_13815 [Oscillibacter sp.]|nr:hypothetical protein [Oscillibacter sp.]